MQAVAIVGQVAEIHAQLVQDGGVEIVDADPVLHGLVSELVGGAVGGAALDAASGHPDTEAAGAVVAAGDAGGPGFVTAAGVRTRHPIPPGWNPADRAA